MSFSFDQVSGGRDSEVSLANSSNDAPGSSDFFDSAGGGSSTESGFDFYSDVDPDLPAVPPGRPPFPVLRAALGVALVGGLLAVLLWGSLIGGLVGWLLAGPIAIFLLGRYMAKDLGMRARPLYDGPSWAAKAPLIGGVVIVCAVVVTAWAIADTVARMAW